MNPDTTIVIASAARTPVGSFNGALASVPAHDLGKVAITAALQRAGVAAADVSEVIMGQILDAGAGQNPARQASINAGIPFGAPAWGMNQLCGSGLRAVALGAQQVLDGAKIVVAGGQESMSQAPHVMYLREGTKMGDVKMIDTMIKDGLWDAFNGYHMGTTRPALRGRAASNSPTNSRATCAAAPATGPFSTPASACSTCRPWHSIPRPCWQHWLR